MFLAGANFVLQFRALSRGPGVLLGDDEFRVYAGIAAAAALLTVLLWQVEGGGAPVRTALFQVLSILTTTGYSSTDFALWGDQAKLVLLAMMFIGGCAGSAAGGPEGAAAHAGGPLHPGRAAAHLPPPRRPAREARRQGGARGRHPLPSSSSSSSTRSRSRPAWPWSSSSGLTSRTAITATAATLGNIGPGFGAVGPLASYGELHPLAKLTLTAAMWIGRLEVVTVLALLRIEVWTSAHWRRTAHLR